MVTLYKMGSVQTLCVLTGHLVMIMAAVMLVKQGVTVMKALVGMTVRSILVRHNSAICFFTLHLNEMKSLYQSLKRIN